jgi:hypothetical protein
MTAASGAVFLGVLFAAIATLAAGVAMPRDRRVTAPSTGATPTADAA